MLPVEASVKDSGPCEKAVLVTVPAEEVSGEFDEVVGELAGKVSLPGFRAGKVPRNVVEKKYLNDIKRQVAGNLIQQAVYAAIKQTNLKTVGEPEFEGLEKLSASRGQPLTFEFKTEVFPPFELPVYNGLKTEQEEIDVLPQEMDEALNGIRERFGEEGVAPEGHAVANKDSVTATLRVLVEGQDVHVEDDARLLVVDGHVFGAHAHLADTFLLGAKVGEKRVIEETLVNSFPVEASRGKKGTIEVEIKDIRFLNLPPLDDELAKKVGMPDLATLTERVRTSLLSKIRDTITDRTTASLLAQIEDKVTIEMPPRALQHAAMNNMKQNLQYMSQAGVTPSSLGISAEGMATQAQEFGKKELHRFFILSAIADKENLQATNEEVDDVVLSMSKQQNIPVQQLFDKLVDEGQIEQIEANIRLKKAVELINDNADITVVPRKPFKNEHEHDHGHDHGGEGDAGHEHALAEGAPAEHGHEHGHDCGHDHGGHDCGHDHGTVPAAAEAEAPAEHGHEHGGHDCGHDHGDAGHSHA